MELSTWLSLVLVCTLGAMSPGPSLAVVLKHSLYQSARHGIVASLAHGLGVGLYATLSLIGLAGLMVQFPNVFKIFVLIGALYLAYLGVMILRSNGAALKVKHSQNNGFVTAAKEGFLIAFMNPKMAIFFLALFSQFIPQEAMTFGVGAIMCLTVLSIDAIWYFFVSVFSVKLQAKFQSEQSNGMIGKLLGIAFILLAGKVLFETLIGN